MYYKENKVFLKLFISFIFFAGGLGLGPHLHWGPKERHWLFYDKHVIPRVKIDKQIHPKRKVIQF